MARQLRGLGCWIAAVIGRVWVTSSCGWLSRSFAAIATASACLCSAAAAQPLEKLVLVVPGSEGGGWDQTATVMKQALEAERLVRKVVIVRRPGAGGLIGLAQFVEARQGDPSALLVGGAVMVGAAQINKSAISLRNATPIARLTGDYEVIAVPVASPIHRIDDLVEVLRRRPGTLHWVGGSTGGPDQQLLWQLAARVGASPDMVQYEPTPGGGDVSDILDGGSARLVGISGYSELAPYAAAGRVRMLAVSAPSTKPFAGLPTLRGSGVDVTMMNWRGVFAAPGLEEADRQRLVSLMTQMSRSPVWARALERHRWQNAFLADAEFGTFVAAEHEAFISQPHVDADGDVRDLVGLLALRYQLALLIGIVALAIIGGLLWQRHQSTRREKDLQAALEAIPSLDPLPGQASVQAAVVAEINREFDSWKLSAAERDVAWFMLKGLPMKEIARLRGTSERTVRQQAQAIYGKAGLEGRSDLAGHVLHECMASTAPTAA
ncbi:tripartite tricarboxylate transporter substrate-binding protein [Phenylobacterium sp.]|uniref:tripartite tricarboxylate transporter substrate-binding protein n=1 Tax=Phenylobacterium sp. TaxID=1871053 RepID=UPI002ED9E97A